jgi:hypothetical protein
MDVAGPANRVHLSCPKECVSRSASRCESTRAAVRAFRTVIRAVVRRDAIADVTHQYQRATAGDRTPGIPALPRPNGGDHLARCRIDHGAAVDHHGRDCLVTASHGANESGRIGIPPDVHLPDGKMMPPQDKTQPPAEHTARPPVQDDPGRGTGLLAGWAHRAIQPLVISPRPRGSGITGAVVEGRHGDQGRLRAHEDDLLLPSRRILICPAGGFTPLAIPIRGGRAGAVRRRS